MPQESEVTKPPTHQPSLYGMAENATNLQMDVSIGHPFSRDTSTKPVASLVTRFKRLIKGRTIFSYFYIQPKEINEICKYEICKYEYKYMLIFLRRTQPAIWRILLARKLKITGMTSTLRKTRLFYSFQMIKYISLLIYCKLTTILDIGGSTTTGSVTINYFRCWKKQMKKHLKL